MVLEIQLDVLDRMDRTTIDGLQMHSRYLLHLVNRHAGTLPLRYIHNVEVYRCNVFIRLLENSEEIVVAARGEIVVVPRMNGQRYTKPAAAERDLERLFHRFNNAFIRRLTLSCRRLDLALPYYLRANADRLQCKIGALHIEDAKERIDDAPIDFLGVQLKPQSYETSLRSRSFESSGPGAPETTSCFSRTIICATASSTWCTR